VAMTLHRDVRAARHHGGPAHELHAMHARSRASRSACSLPQSLDARRDASRADQLALTHATSRTRVMLESNPHTHWRAAPVDVDYAPRRTRDHNAATTMSRARHVHGELQRDRIESHRVVPE
jgi:hypothetical protein